MILRAVLSAQKLVSSILADHAGLLFVIVRLLAQARHTLKCTPHTQVLSNSFSQAGTAVQAADKTCKPTRTYVKRFDMSSRSCRGPSDIELRDCLHLCHCTEGRHTWLDLCRALSSGHLSDVRTIRRELCCRPRVYAGLLASCQ